MGQYSGFVRRGAAALAASVALMPLAGGAAHAADAQPRDFMPAPAGTKLGLLYYSYTTSDNYVDRDGNDVPDSGLDTNVAILRYVQYFNLGDMLADFNVIVPMGKLSNMQLGGPEIDTKDFGIGDATFVFTVFPYINHDKKQYVGIATYLNMPTGDYDADEPGLGTNRWSMTVQPAYYFNLAPKWSVDLVGDITVYGDNDDGPGGATIEQDPSYTAIAWLNYQATETGMLSLGVSASWFGEQSVGGVDQGDGNVTTIRAAWSQMLNPTTQLLVELGTDVDAENTFERDTTALVRLAKFF